MAEDYPQGMGFRSQREFEEWRRASDVDSARPLPPGYRDLEEIYFGLPVNLTHPQDLEDTAGGFRHTNRGPMQGVRYLLELADGADVSLISEAGVRTALAYCSNYLIRFPEFREALAGELRKLEYGQAVMQFLDQAL